MSAVRYFGDKAGNFARFFGSDKRLQLLHHVIPKITAIQQESKKSLSILDIGAGTGMHADYFAKQGHHVVAVDPTEEMIEQGKKRYDHANLHFTIDALPSLEKLANQKFDIIYSIAAWQYIKPEERELAMKRVAALLKPGGAFIIVWPIPISREFQFDLSVDQMHESIHAANQHLPQNQQLTISQGFEIPDPDERMGHNNPQEKVCFYSTIGQLPAPELQNHLTTSFSLRKSHDKE